MDITKLLSFIIMNGRHVDNSFFYGISSAVFLYKSMHSPRRLRHECRNIGGKTSAMNLRLGVYSIGNNANKLSLISSISDGL